MLGKEKLLTTKMADRNNAALKSICGHDFSWATKGNGEGSEAISSSPWNCVQTTSPLTGPLLHPSLVVWPGWNVPFNTDYSSWLSGWRMGLCGCGQYQLLPHPPLASSPWKVTHKTFWLKTPLLPHSIQ